MKLFGDAAILEGDYITVTFSQDNEYTLSYTGFANLLGDGLYMNEVVQTRTDGVRCTEFHNDDNVCILSDRSKSTSASVIGVINRSEQFHDAMVALDKI